MRLALELAEKALEEGQDPFGAVVVDARGEIIGQGYNAVRAERDPLAHGEAVALRDAWRRSGSWQALAGGTMYSNCEACLSCSFAILQARLARVVFAAYDSDVPGWAPPLGGGLRLVASWVNAQPDWPPLEVVGGVLREQAAATLRSWSEDAW